LGACLVKCPQAPPPAWPTKEPQAPQALPEVKQEAPEPPQLRLRGQRYFVGLLCSLNNIFRHRRDILARSLC
jgi:hypothetical protein